MVEAARLAEAIAQVPGLAGTGVLMTIADGQLTVRLARGVFRLEERHVRLARAVSAVVREHNATSDRTRVQEVSFAISARPDAIDVGFWRAVLGYAELADDNAVDPLGHGSTVWMQDLDPAKPLRHAMHVDVSVAREQAEHRVANALAAGGRIVDGSGAPAGWILADHAGNRVCVAAWPDGAQCEVAAGRSEIGGASTSESSASESSAGGASAVGASAGGAATPPRLP